jgi:hypothetical protein
VNKRLAFFIVLTAMSFPNTARCDLFGGDVAVLVNILANAVQQLAQLRSIVSNGQDALQLAKDINKGINDSLSLMSTVSPDTAPGLYSNWQKGNQSLQAVQSIYGTVVPSKDARVQQDADLSVAEAVTLNNSIYGYTAEIDSIGEQVKASSHTASPAGAQKLTAETLGVMLHVMNQSLRAQATGLKLQAQALAIQNHKDKDGSRQLVADTDSLTTAMKTEPMKFGIPRF